MAETIKDFILNYTEKHPNATAEQILPHVQRHFKGCSTTVASVASTLSRARTDAGKKDELPTVRHESLPDHNPEEDTETEDEARKRISVRYDAMARMSRRLISGMIPSLIISGPPGIGKSHTVHEAIVESGRQRHDGFTDVNGGGKFGAFNEETGEREETPGWYDQISGSITAVGLYHALWNMRNGGVLVLDDCDDVFRDETALNLLKIATDSTKERLVSWRKNAAWLDEYEIDKTFDFQGHIIFLTNIDFEDVVERGHKDADHFKAIIDRAFYLCLTLRTKRDFMIRINDVSTGKNGMLAKSHNLNDKDIKEVLEFIAENQKKFYNLSLRLVGQIAISKKADPDSWKADVEATKMRTRA